MKAGGNSQWFVHFGDNYPGYPFARQVFGDRLYHTPGNGHDGQAFWLLARDPFLLDGHWSPRDHLDRPSYRAQRVAYPLFAAPWRLGGEQALVWGLLAMNLAAVFLGGYAAARLAMANGASPRAGLAFALNPGVGVATMLDVADGLALALLLVCLLALHNRRTGRAIAAGVVAVLAKESSLLVLFGAAMLAPTLSRRARLLIVLLPVAVGLVWAGYVRMRLGWQPAGVREFAAPFQGYLDAYRLIWRPAGNWGYAAIAGLVLLAAAAAVWRWWRRPNLILSAAVPLACVVPFFSVHVLDLALNPMRAAAPLITLLLLDLFGHGEPGRAEPAPNAQPASPPRKMGT
jgi:hypothetical protein